MRTIVYAPFLVSLAAVALSRLVLRRLAPRAAAWGLTLAAGTLAMSTTGAVALLACPLPARVPAIAALGGWQPRSIAVATPVPTWLSVVALAGGVWLTWRVVAEVRRLTAELGQVGGAHARLAGCGLGEVVVVHDANPQAHALYGTPRRRGRIVLTTGMLDLLDREEQAAVVAHERAHLHHHHIAFVAVTRLATALNPLLSPIGPDLDFALERWADEDAATVTERSVIASALAKAAIAALHGGQPGSARQAMALHVHAVPERVAALLDDGALRWRLVWLFVAVSTVAMVSLAWAMHDTERLFEAVRLWQRP